MGWKNKRWATVKRAKLVQQLGGECKFCQSTEELEIDHINGRDYDIRRLGSDTRVSRYVKEAKQGLLQVLCKSCNSEKQ